MFGIYAGKPISFQLLFCWSRNWLISNLWTLCFRVSYCPCCDLMAYLFSSQVLSTMPNHKEFETAGKKPGLQVWRVEKMDLKPVPKELHGNFYTGDSYILLYTTSAPSYYVHSWTGNRLRFSVDTSKQTLGYYRIKCTSVLSFILQSFIVFLFLLSSVIPQAKRLLQMKGGLLPSLWPSWMTTWVEPQYSPLSFKIKSQSNFWATSSLASNTRWIMIYEHMLVNHLKHIFTKIKKFWPLPLPRDTN